MQSTAIAPTPDAALAARPIAPSPSVRSSVEIRHIVFFLNDALDEKLFARMERAPEQVSLAETLIELLRFRGRGALGYPWNAKSVEDAVRAQDGKDYRLLRVRVLPNHVHVLLEASPSWPSGDPIHRWKATSSPRRTGTPRPGLKRYGMDRLRPRALRLDQPRPDEFWADEDFEVILRTREEVEEVYRLIDGISPPARPHAQPSPDDEDAPPAADPRPRSPPKARPDRKDRPSGGSCASRRGIRWWLEEIGQCARDLSVLYGAFFFMVWFVWALQQTLRHWHGP